MNPAVIVDGLQVSNFFQAGQMDYQTYDPNRELMQQWRNGGIDCVHLTCVIWEDARQALTSVSRWYRAARDNTDLVLIARTVDDIYEAKRTGRTAIMLGLQNASPFEDELGLVEVFYELGVRVGQLTYNIQNHVGGSCYEPNDSGLSRFGHFVIQEMNRVGMLIDLSHVGDRTSLEAIDASSVPVTVSHAMPRSAYEHVRNKPDEVLKALARRDGIFGLSIYPALMGDDVSLRGWCTIVARACEVMGAENVAIGSDMALCWTLQDAMTMSMGRWTFEPDYGAHTAEYPGWAPMPDWFEDSSDFPTLAAGLLDLGMTQKEVDGIMGENWMRLFKQTLVPEDATK